jgi:hypothetical protein
VLVPQVESKEQKEDVVVLGAHVALRTEPQSGSQPLRDLPMVNGCSHSFNILDNSGPIGPFTDILDSRDTAP